MYSNLNIEVDLIIIHQQFTFDSITVFFCWLLATMSCPYGIPRTTMRYKLQCGGSYCCCSPSRGSYRGRGGGRRGHRCGGHRCGGRGGCLTCTSDAPCWKSTQLLSPVASQDLCYHCDCLRNLFPNFLVTEMWRHFGHPWKLLISSEVFWGCHDLTWQCILDFCSPAN